MSTYSAALPALRRALVFGPDWAEFLDPVSLLISPNIGQRLFRLSSLSLQQKPEQYDAIMHSLRLRRKFCGIQPSSAGRESGDVAGIRMDFMDSTLRNEGVYFEAVRHEIDSICPAQRNEYGLFSG